MAEEKNTNATPANILTQEQDELLDLYIQKLDSFFEELKQAEKTEVAIETQHLKRILSKSS
ncbi:hypothetical protein [uncultured Pontibacter sp.]|uniref:hypothetical protein n=1 Tax=uncultured Pontibacter sp. TaxID=453356 RepID=UPI002636C408|nr:hypothetical protein [uncultured Pontibacter sp.]